MNEWKKARQGRRGRGRRGRGRLREREREGGEREQEEQSVGSSRRRSNKRRECRAHGRGIGLPFIHFLQALQADRHANRADRPNDRVDRTKGNNSPEAVDHSCPSTPSFCPVSGSTDHAMPCQCLIMPRPPVCPLGPCPTNTHCD